MTNYLNTDLTAIPSKSFLHDNQKWADKIIDYILFSFFFGGIFLALFYNTWVIGIGVGGACLTAYYITKNLLPDSDLYQYVLSGVFALFMAQYIYQMHGMFEMHFIAFIGCTILIAYQNWRIQIPLLIILLIHHAVFGYLQYIGLKEVYFTQLAYMDIQTFLIHGFFTATIVFISGLWAYRLRRNSILDSEKNIELGRLQKEEEQKKVIIESIEKLEAANLREEEINTNLINEIAQRERQSSELKKLNASLDQFAQIVSHDLKAPLRAIKSLTTFIEDDLEVGALDSVKKNMNTMRGRIGRLESLVIGILDYSMAGKKSANIQEIDINKLVDEVVDLLSPPEGFVFEIQKDMPFIQADVVKTQQVFSNLVSNAVKYHNSNTGIIKITCTENARNYEFSVKDDGPGIDPIYHEKVFGMFQTLQSRKTIESTGIGLAIVKKIIEDAGGSIRLESEIGKGANFILIWPKITMSADSKLVNFEIVEKENRY